LIHALQAAAGGSGSSVAAANKSLNAMMGEALPRARGYDERAARARKTAAARGLKVRPHGGPVQAAPPLTQLLNIINSGNTPVAADNGNANGALKDEDVAKKEATGPQSEANGPPSSDSTDAEKSAPVQEPAPVGLGKGLSSLDNKKQKSKPKAGA
jgi:protein TIF31